jgi:hypothetical protein
MCVVCYAGFVPGERHVEAGIGSDGATPYVALVCNAFAVDQLLNHRSFCWLGLGVEIDKLFKDPSPTTPLPIGDACVLISLV